MLTTDGSMPAFYENGVIDFLIKVCIEKGIPLIDAYLMATLNPAKYFNLDHLHGLIATGRVADINFLEKKDNPTPISVLAKGKWVKRDGVVETSGYNIDLEALGFSTTTEMNWNLSKDDLQFSMPFGINLESTVITKPYSITSDLHSEKIFF
jgi:adenine deaminase